jgi:hypothetical protein
MKLRYKNRTIVLVLLGTTSLLMMYVGFAKEYLIIQSFVKYVCRECIGLGG